MFTLLTDNFLKKNLEIFCVGEQELSFPALRVELDRSTELMSTTRVTYIDD